MDLLEFTAISALNLALITFIIRRWSVLSAEGLCMAYLGLAVVTDNAEVVFDYFLRPDQLPLGLREIAFRIYPTEIHILGLLMLIMGLIVANANPASVSRELTGKTLIRLRNLGSAIFIVGLALSGAGLYFARAFSGGGIYAVLNTFRTAGVNIGGFWYRGADVAIFGLALVLPSLQTKKWRSATVFFLMMAISFFLRTNKGGFEQPILWGAVVLGAYNREWLRSFLRMRTIALSLVLAFAGISAKMLFLPLVLHGDSPSASATRLIHLATATVEARWGDVGLYRGYCQFVHMLPENRAIFRDSRVARYTFVSWIPRLIYPNKPDHPFRGIGYMIYSDFHSSPEESPAPTLVGSALADDGLISLSQYLFLAGLFLGFLRRALTRNTASLNLHVLYVFFVLFGGFSAEEGILGAVSMLMLGCGVLILANILLFVFGLARFREPESNSLEGISATL